MTSTLPASSHIPLTELVIAVAPSPGLAGTLDRLTLSVIG